MMDPTPALTANSNVSTSTGNVFVDAFLANAGKSARLDSGDEQWSEIEAKFEIWWTKYQAWNYDEINNKDEQKDHDEALRVLRSSLHAVFELERGCLMLPIDLLLKYTGISRIRKSFNNWRAGISREDDGYFGDVHAPLRTLPDDKRPKDYDAGDDSLFN